MNHKLDQHLDQQDHDQWSCRTSYGSVQSLVLSQFKGPDLEALIVILNWTSGILKLLINQIKTLPVLLESSKVVTDVIPFFSSSMPEVLDDCNCSFLALVLVNSLEIFSGNVGAGAMFDVDNRFVTHILSDKVLGIIVILLPVVVTDWIYFPIWLLDFMVNIRLNLE